MHINKINKKKYIGITRQKPEARWGKDGINYRGSPHFFSAIQEYGWDNFEHIILAQKLSQQAACNMEIQYITKYKTQDNNFGYNIMGGGTAPTLPQEVRDKISKSMMGNKNGLGKTCSEEKKQKISQAQKGRSLTEKHRQALRKPKSITHPCSEEKR